MGDECSWSLCRRDTRLRGHSRRLRLSQWKLQALQNEPKEPVAALVTLCTRYSLFVQYCCKMDSSQSWWSHWYRPELVSQDSKREDPLVARDPQSQLAEKLARGRARFVESEHRNGAITIFETSFVNSTGHHSDSSWPGSFGKSSSASALVIRFVLSWPAFWSSTAAFTSARPFHSSDRLEVPSRILEFLAKWFSESRRSCTPLTR